MSIHGLTGKPGEQGMSMKQFDGVARSPATQFQIGQHVIYLPEGVVTTIAGYVWDFGNDGQPSRIHAYRLACGCNAQQNTIARQAAPEPPPPPEDVGGVTKRGWGI